MNREPKDMKIDYETMRVHFGFGLFDFSLPISSRAVATRGGVFEETFARPHVLVFVEEDDVKKLCLENNHSLADFEAIRRGIKAFLRDYQVYVDCGVEYRVRREDILTAVVVRVRAGERVPKEENRESEAA